MSYSPRLVSFAGEKVDQVETGKMGYQLGLLCSRLRQNVEVSCNYEGGHPYKIVSKRRKIESSLTHSYKWLQVASK